MPLTLSQLLESATLAYKRHDHTTAERNLRIVIREEPRNVRASVLLGIICVKTGRLEEAQGHLETALSVEPNDLDALGSLAMLRKSQNDFAGAIDLLQRAIGVRSDDPNLFNELGLCWLSLRNGIKAAHAFKKEIALQPRGVQGYFNLGMALKLATPSGSSREAYRTFLRVVELDPEFIPSYVQIFNQMQRLLNWHEGLSVLEEGLNRNPDSAVIKVALAATHGKLGNPLEADRLFRSAWACDPSAGPPYAHWLQEEGQFEASAEILKDSIRLGSQEGIAYHNLAEARCFEVDGRSLVDLVLDRLSMESPKPEDRMYLHYALAKAYDNEKDFEAAMGQYDKANDLAYQVFHCRESFNLEAMVAESEAIQKVLSRRAVAKLMEHGSPSEQPIFIVGMIRSGTTLLDQILSSHPMVRSAGEQPFWAARAGPTVLRWRNQEPEPSEVRRLADEFLTVLNRATGESPRITDKMPVNFRHLGLIRSAFPNARIIHMRRNPMDTAVSIYTTYLGRATNFAYNQPNIVGAYLNYRQAMDHWRTALPSERFLEIDYEQLVSDTESVVRQLIGFCGLPWDEACLSPERNTASVSTPSLWTARQPVNAGSVGRWRRYEPWLGRLMDLAAVSPPGPR